MSTQRVWGMIICVAIAAIAFSLRPGGRLARTPLTISKLTVLVVAASVVAWSTLCCAIALRFDPEAYYSGTIPAGDGERVNDYRQYNHFADALLDGVTYLELDVPSWLAEMENPYDAPLRRELALESGEPYLFDYAFYDGKYQCYFGVVPALLTFMPYKVLTGTDLRTDYATVFFAVCAIAAGAFFLYEFLRRYWSHANLAQFVLFHALLVTGAGIVTQVFIPFFYALPPLSGLAFVLLGLGLWLSSKKQGGGLSGPRLVAGSTSIALIMGCRPQMFLAVSLAFPLFWGEIVHEREFFSRKGLANTLCVMLPCLAVGIPLMVFNGVRFSSPLDFGASYNLTGFDLTAKANSCFSFRIAAISLWYYLFIPPNPMKAYPFFEVIKKAPFMSMVAIEPYYASFVWCAPASAACFALPWVRKRLQRDGTCMLTSTCIAISVVLMIVSAQVSSISMRYFTDFGWAIVIATICIWMSAIGQDSGDKRAMVLSWVLWALIVVGVLFCCWQCLCDGRYHRLSRTAPAVYEFFKAMFS